MNKINCAGGGTKNSGRSLYHTERSESTDFCNGCASLEKSLFASLSDNERQSLNMRSIVLHFKKGQTVFLEGREAQGIFCIKSGVIKLSLDTVIGESITVHLFSNKGIFGQYSIISSISLYTAVCLTDCELCFFSRKDIQNYLKLHPCLLDQLAKVTVQEIKTLNNVIVSLRSKSIVQRVAETLINLQSLFGKDPKGYIHAEFTKQELSNIVGASIESVFRALTSLKEKGYVTQHNRRFKIVDELRLKKLAKAH